MAAGNNEYVIRIELGNLPDGSNGPVSNPSVGSSNDLGSGEKSYWAKSADSAKAAAQKIVSVGTAASIADNLISYEVNSVSLRTGATEYEQKLQFGYSTLKSTAVPLVVGAATGGLPGAAIGLVMGLAMQGIQWAQNARTMIFNQNLENVSIGMATVRAGVTGSRSDKQ